MAKHSLPLLTGGLNEVARSDLIDDSELSRCLNYKIEGDGRLVKRNDVSAVDHDQSFSESLMDWQERNAYHAWRVEAWNPNFAIDMTKHPTAESMIQNVPVMVVVNTETIQIGDSETDKLRVDLWYRYREAVYHDDQEVEYKWTNEVSWEGGVGKTVNQLLEEAYIEYHYGHSDIRMDIADDRVVIADGINVCHFITVNKDGEVNVGPMGFGSPKNKLRFTRFMDSTDNDDVGIVPEAEFSSEVDDAFSTPGYLQATYTVVDIYGNESNPAPYSDTLHIDYFKLDESLDTHYLDYVQISDLSIPIVGSALKEEELRDFKIYFRYFRYREGTIGDLVFTWTQSEKIIEKAEYGSTANSYRLDIPLSEAVGQISYENDPAPYAHQIASLNGVSLIGDIISIPTYPWNFKHQHPIEIKNTNNTHYVDAVVRIRLTQPPCHSAIVNPIYECNEIDKLNLLDFFRKYDQDWGGPPEPGAVQVHAPRADTSPYIRFFDTDQTTPLQVIARNAMYQDNAESEHSVDLFIKIPLLPGSGTRTIYLCWTPIGPGFTTPAHAQHEVHRMTGVGGLYNMYPKGHGTLLDPSASKDYWQHSAIYYGAITTRLSNHIIDLPSGFSTKYMFLNFRHQRIFQSKGVWSEDVLVSSPGDANFLTDESNSKITNRVDKSFGGAFTDTHGTIIRGWDQSSSNLQLNSVSSQVSDGETTVDCVNTGEARVRIPAMFTGPRDEGEATNDYTERTIGYGGYQTTSESYKSTLNYGNLGGIGLYRDSFTIMFNLCWLDPTSTGNPTNNTSILFTMYGNEETEPIRNKLQLTVLHPDHTENFMGRDIWRLYSEDAGGILRVTYFTNDGAWVETPHPDNAPQQEWLKKDSVNPVEWGNPREQNSNANKFICFSVEGWETDDITTVSLWIYDQDTNDVNYITYETYVAPFLQNGGGLSEFAVMGDTEFVGAPPDGYQRKDAIVQQLIFEKDRVYDFTKPDDVNAMWHRINAMPGYRDPIGFYYKGDDEQHNEKIVFSKTALIFQNRERSLIKWSAINNFSFPTLNAARLGEPVSAIIPAPSFLRFKYANTFLVFTRNTIKRVQVYPDVGSLPDVQTDESIFQNVIAEKKNYGLLARDTLTLAGDSLYWLSEVGIIRWSKDGMEIISKNRVSPELEPYIYAFVNPIDNQYIIGIPPDYLIDYWTPGPALPFNPNPGHGQSYNCCSCCVPLGYYHGATRVGDNMISCHNEEQCKDLGGMYSDHMCEPRGVTPWWLPPDEWEFHRCSTCDIEQPDGWNIFDWCESQEFGEVAPPPDESEGCVERNFDSCYYNDIYAPEDIIEQGFDDYWWAGRVCRLSTFWEQMQIENAQEYGMSGWPFTRYSEYWQGQWGAPPHHGWTFMNFHELDVYATTGSGTQAFYNNLAHGPGGHDDQFDPIGSCAKFNIYYPNPPGYTEPDEGGGRSVYLNGRDLLQRFESVLKYYPNGWSEWLTPLFHHKYAGNSDDRWRFTFTHFGGGMAMRVRDCPIPGAAGMIHSWDGPRFVHSASEVYLREYNGYPLNGPPAGNFNSEAGFWWVDTYLASWSSLIPFALEDSPYWGNNRFGFNRSKNPYKVNASATRSGRDDLVSGDYHVHNLDDTKFTRYTGFDVQWSTVGKKLNGDIVNWVIDGDGKIHEWPGSTLVDYAVVRTKVFYVENGSIRKVKVDYDGNSDVGISVHTMGKKRLDFKAVEDSEHEGGGIIVTPKHYDPMSQFTTSKDLTISNIQSNQWRGLALNKFSKFSLTIQGADVINSVFYDIHIKSKVGTPEQPTVTYEKEGYLDPVESGRKKE